MKIRLELETHEFQKLIQLVYLGNWMVNSIAEDRDEAYDKVEQKVYQLAPDAELEGAFELDEESGELFASEKFEEGPVAAAIDRYDEHTLWQELADRMARVELGKRYSKDDLTKLPDEERDQLWDEAAKPFLEEFEKNGVKRLRVADDLA